MLISDLRKYMAKDSIALEGSINQSHSITDFFYRLLRRNWRIGLIILAIYNTLVIISIPSVYIHNAQSPQPRNWWTLMVHFACEYNLWTIATPFVLCIGYIFPIGRRHFLRNLVLHLFSAVLTGMFIYTGTNLTNWVFVKASKGNLWSALLNINLAGVVKSVTGAIVQYSIILITQKAYLHYRKYRDREFRLQQAELVALKTQLHPHFLFNTLNAISALVYVAPRDATKTIAQLSDLLRQTLRHNKAQEVTLKDELDFLRKYLQIQQTLLQERLEIEWTIEPETLDAFVPNMLLQPLVENSIQHGIAPKKDGGRIEIFSRQVGNSLLLEIKDSGLGSLSNQEKSGGIGLKNSAARLYHLYGENQKFESAAITPTGGWRVTMSIPFREQSQ